MMIAFKCYLLILSHYAFLLSAMRAKLSLHLKSQQAACLQNCVENNENQVLKYIFYLT